MKSLCITLVAGAAFCRVATAADLADGIRAVVSEAVITDRQVKLSAAQAVDLLRRQAAGNLLTPELFERKVAETIENATQALVDRQLIVHDFQTAGYKLPETILEDAIQARIKEQYGDRMTMIKTLQAEGRTEEKLRQQIREQIIIAALQQKNISSEIIISPHKIAAYYEQHQDQYKLEDQVKLRMIVVDSTASATPPGRKELAGEILTKLKEGADFAQMAQVYSSGSQRKEGGDWGWIERSVLRKELADVAFALEPKKLSGVVETPDACYVMLVEDKRSAHVRPLSEVRDEIEKNLLIEERARLQQKYIKKLRDKTFTRYF